MIEGRCNKPNPSDSEQLCSIAEGHEGPHKVFADGEVKAEWRDDAPQEESDGELTESEIEEIVEAKAPAADPEPQETEPTTNAPQEPEVTLQDIAETMPPKHPAAE